MHYLIIFAILFFATEPLQPTIKNLYLSVLTNGTVLGSIDGTLHKIELSGVAEQVVSGWVAALIYDDAKLSQLQIKKICTLESKLHAFSINSNTNDSPWNHSLQTIDMETCTYNPPIRTTYYTESTTPWLKGKPLNASVFRVAYSSKDKAAKNAECISEEESRSYLNFLSTNMRLLTNNRAFFDLHGSFISPMCIPESYTDTDPPNNYAIQFLNIQNASLYDDSPSPQPVNPVKEDTYNFSSDPNKHVYEWLKTVPARSSFRLFISSVFPNHNSYKLTLNSSELFSYTASYWNGGPWIYISDSPSSIGADTNTISSITGFMRSFWHLAELGSAKIVLLESIFNSNKEIKSLPDPMEVMGSGEATEFSVPSLTWQIYQMGVVSPYLYTKINPSGSSVEEYKTFFLLASDCPYTRSFTHLTNETVMAIEIKLDSSFISRISRPISFILEYRRASAYSFGGLSIRIIAGEPQSPGSTFDSISYSIQSEIEASDKFFLAMAQPIPGRAWRCPMCDLNSFDLIVDRTTAPFYIYDLADMLEKTAPTLSNLSYAIVSYIYYPAQNANRPHQSSLSGDNNASDLTFLPFELTIPPGVACTSFIPIIEGQSIPTINCSIYTYLPNSIIFNVRPVIRRGGGTLRYYILDAAYSWPHYTFSYSSTLFSGGVDIDQSVFWYSITPSVSERLRIKLNGPTNTQKELPATLLVNYVCGWQHSSDDTISDIADVYNSKAGHMANALLIFTDEHYKALLSTVPRGYIAIRDMSWNMYTWVYHHEFEKAIADTMGRPLLIDDVLSSDIDLRRDYEFTYRVWRLPYVDTQCTFKYYAHVYTEKESLSNYSNVYTYTHYKSKTKRIAITNLDYSSESYTFTSASMPNPETTDYDCTSVMFTPTLFQSKRWYVLMDYYNADDVEIYIDFHTDLPEYLVIFVSTIRDIISIDCRMLAVIQRSVRDDAGNVVMISYKVSLKDLVGDPSFKHNSDHATNGVSISFSDDVTLMNIRIVSVKPRAVDPIPPGPPAPEKREQTNSIDTDPSKYTMTIPSGTILCSPKDGSPTTWAHDQFNVVINNVRYAVLSSVMHTVNIGYVFSQGLYTVPYKYWDERYSPDGESMVCADKTYLWRGLNSSLTCVPCPDGSVCKNNIRKSCDFGFFTSKNSDSCDRVYPGDYTTITEEIIYKEPSYHVQYTPDGSGYLTTNCLPYLFMNKAFCTPCIPLGYLCIPGKEQIPCPKGFRCIRGVAIPCINSEYQHEEGQSICHRDLSTLSCDIIKNQTSVPYSIVEQEYTVALPLAIHSMVTDRPNAGCRMCPAGYACTTTNHRATLSITRCAINEYSPSGMAKCKRCPYENIQSAVGDTCTRIPLKVRNDANVDPHGNLCSSTNCPYTCVNNVCVSPRIPSWATVVIYISITILLTTLLIIFIKIIFKYYRKYKVRRRRCEGL